MSLRCISKRRHDESRFQASLHGMQIKSDVADDLPAHSEADEARVDASMRLAMMMKRQEAKRANG